MKDIILFTVLILSAVSSSYATELPDYRQVIDAQYKCDRKVFEQFPWEKKLEKGRTGLAVGVVGVISDLKITEIKPRISDRVNRTFKLTYTGFAEIDCRIGQMPGSKRVKGQRIEMAIAVEGALADPGYFTIFDASEPGLPELGPQYIHSMNAPEGWPDKGEGMNCLVKLEDLLKNPGLIPIDRICAGNTPAEIASTKKEISKLIVQWKKAGFKPTP